MKKLLIIAIFSLMMIPPMIQNSNSLVQYGAEINMNIKPGETKPIEWQLRASEGESDIELKIGARGWGSQFFTYPETLLIPEGEIGTVKASVTIPADHPGGVVLGEDNDLRLTATQLGEPGGATLINIRASKIIILNVLQNENSQYWTNKAYDEPEKMAQPESVAKPEMEEKTEKEAPSPFVISQSPEKEAEPEGGGCLISTATYGTELAPQVQMLREIRDGSLLATGAGSSFMVGFNTLYYSFSPAIADLERQSPIFREAVKITITPLITSLSLLNHVDLDSEQEVLGYGISLILLNIGMYFAAPAIIISKIRKRL